ncbi:MAG: hypothetical protein KIT33_02335 [Candidatus Kapabacteria bacterium]|nr:hypothetical protein [Ignavibacteriota bacterium]MCW5883788.1 hypothetical protein [Candidatus Kapabacteria bacterium]
MKKLTKFQSVIFLTIVIIALCSVSTKSQEIDTLVSSDEFDGIYKKMSNLFDNSVGVSYSNFSGYGISFSRRFAKDYTVRITGIGTYYEVQEWKSLSKEDLTVDKKDISMNVGAEFQRDLIVSTNTRVYTMLGCSYFNIDNRNLSSGNLTIQYSAGFGFGFDLFIHENFSGFLALAYKYDYINEEISQRPKLTKKTDIGFGLGISFYF